MTLSIALPRVGAWKPARENAARADGLGVELIDTRAKFDALRDEWNALFARAATPAQVFQSHDILGAWADAYDGAWHRLAIVIVRRDGVLALVWPMAIMRQCGFSRLVFMGLPAVQFGDALVEDAPDRLQLVMRAWEALRALNVDAIVLGKVRSDAAIADALRRLGARACETQSAPCLEFSSFATWEDVSAHQPQKQRAQRRRLARRLEETGTITFETVGPGEQAARLAARAVELKLARGQAHGRLATTLADRRFGRFLENLARTEFARINLMSRDGAAIGVEFSLACKDGRIGYVIAHDPEFDKQGAGVSLAEHSLRSAFEAGAKKFDMLAPADAYKLSWANGACVVEDFGFARSLPGWLYVRGWIGGGRTLTKRLAYAIAPRILPALAALRRLCARRHDRT